MADFEKAYKTLEKWEGGYANIKEDAGGETYKGITRKNYPNMSFWKKIDSLKKEKLSIQDIDSILSNDLDVYKEIKDFYKKNYWDIFEGDIMPNQAFTENIFLLCVNAGARRGIKVGQTACGFIGKEIDGKYGAKTKDRFFNAGENEVKLFNEIEINFYKSLVEKRPSNKIFLRGWLARAKAV
ncbi:glycosyl hydrolase 108 family protein [uncultured Brachyspira sp.]|uniref:glycosyl hydrolase 108 family protein n=1 Tax=uncultured Brachyspira sp. TaxID=221953 RepID=UPI0025849571|nr:glycosyl hydrolase 108 family protein [uncultured Brachyspira sp.]